MINLFSNKKIVKEQHDVSGYGRYACTDCYQGCSTGCTDGCTGCSHSCSGGCYSCSGSCMGRCDACAAIYNPGTPATWG